VSRPADSSGPAILFDWDNTLVNTWPTIVECYRDTFTALGQTPWTAQEVRDRAHGSLRDAFPRCSASAPARPRRCSTRPSTASISSGWSRCRAPSAAGARAPRLLRRRGEQQGRRQPARRAGPSRLGALDIRAVGAKDCPRDKPAPDPIFLALDGTGIAPDHTVWMVGDTPADLKCAHAAGVLPVYFGSVESCRSGCWNSAAPACTRLS
jgi:phosphoglycolate phosphatase